MKTGYRRRCGTYPEPMGAYGPVPLATLISRPVVDLGKVAIGWPWLWERVYAELRRRGYQRDTLRIYRHVLRRFAQTLARPVLAHHLEIAADPA